jgi:K(+)-stimulated pyrophosphate-energized sodium pump
LAVELAEQMKLGDKTVPLALSVIFFVISMVFVYRSFYGMRIEITPDAPAAEPKEAE